MQLDDRVPAPSFHRTAEVGRHLGDCLFQLDAQSRIN